jgi:superfamily II RNA helicase
MVKVCELLYAESDTKYKKIFDEYSFELDHFQKYAIHGIEDGVHVLLTASTGCGKTLPAEHAIKKYCRNGKKVIYTAPIKSLSNQKFYEFSKKYPDISFGILTGDIKFNPEADCVIMTTEILRNTLFRQSEVSKEFTIDIDSLACVIFDEIHYINDRDRGKVWEETIIKLPIHVQMVMLSATIDRPEEFAKWIEHTKGVPVWLTSTNTRVVPLNHYSYFKVQDNVVKNLKDTTVLEILNRINGNLIPIKMQNGNFKKDTISDLHKITKALEAKQIFIKPKFILNQICRHLKETEKLPAICFVFSRKNVVEYAQSIEMSLFNEYNHELKYPSIIAKECRHIISKLPNYHEYINLPEYNMIVNLLEKGVAIHHSGILPVLREMIEMLFSKGYIKMLFATETFAVGVNMPTKTVLYTGLSKFDGNGFRDLLSHEYTQMAGRAGRRGLDTVGHVIHLNGMFDVPSIHEYETIMNSKPQTLISKFEIDFSLLLKLLKIKEETTNDTTSTCNVNTTCNTMCNTTCNTLEDIVKEFVSKSMITNEIEKESQEITMQICKLIEDIEKKELIVTTMKTPLQTLLDYKELQQQIEMSKNKQRKRLMNDLETFKTHYPTLESDYNLYEDLENNLKKQLEDKKQECEHINQHINTVIANVKAVLLNNEFIDYQDKITPVGIIASQIQELDCLAFAKVLDNKCLNTLETNELVSVLSSFTSIRVPEEKQVYHSENQKVAECMAHIVQIYDLFYDIELNCCGYIDDSKFTIVYDLQDELLKWCETSTEEECKIILQRILGKGIFLGEFVKSVLKINNIAQELIKVLGCCENTDENMQLKYKLSCIPEMTLKYVATNQSLYI